MAACVNITSMTVCPTLVTTTHCVKMASIITLVFVSQVSMCSFHHKDKYYSIYVGMQPRATCSCQLGISRVTYYVSEVRRVCKSQKNKLGLLLDLLRFFLAASQVNINSLLHGYLNM